MKNKIIPLLIIFLICALFLTSCSDKKIYVDYSIDNNYEVVVTDTDDYLSFGPSGANPSYGLLFYVGTFISPSAYTYIGNELAKKGYLMVIPKADLTFAYFGYQEHEIIYDIFSDVKFFIGGHSQGGGAAIRRADENENKTIGLILLAPLAGSRLIEQGEETIDYYDSISDTTIPTLLLEASEDHILNATQKADAKSRLPENYDYYLIKGGCHMCFAERDPMLTDGPLINMTREEQNSITINKIEEFMNTIVNK